jgi:hypothetical protein
LASATQRIGQHQSRARNPVAGEAAPAEIAALNRGAACSISRMMSVKYGSANISGGDGAHGVPFARRFRQVQRAILHPRWQIAYYVQFVIPLNHAIGNFEKPAITSAHFA